VLILIAPLVLGGGELLKPEENLKPPAAKSGSILAEKAVTAAIALTAIAMIGLFYVAPYIQPFFAQEYGVSSTKYGLIAASSMVAFIGGMAVANVFKEKVSTSAALYLGFAFAGLGFNLLGPSPLLAFMPADGVWEPILAYYVLIFGLCIPLIISPPLSLEIAVALGFDEEDAAVQSATASVFLTSIGFFFGPSLGGSAAGSLGYPVAGLLGGFGMVVLGATVTFLVALWSPALKPKDNKEMV